MGAYFLGYALSELYARVLAPHQGSHPAQPGGLNHSHGHRLSPLCQFYLRVISVLNLYFQSP